MISVFNTNSFKKVRDFAGLTAACVLVFGTANSLNFIQDNIVKAANSQTANLQKAKPSSQQKQIIAKANSMLQKNNISEAIKYINSNIKNLSNSNASIVVNNLEAAQERYLPTLEKKYENTNILLNTLLTQTKECGYKVDTAEGMYFPVIDYEIYKKYSNYVTKDIGQYINIMAVESNNAPAKDAGIVIGWKELINRALNQEKFIKNYKYSIRYSKVMDLYKKYIFFIMYGLNNTPLFDYSNNTMNAEAKKAYIEAVKSTGDSKLLNVMKEYLKVVQKGNYKLTKDVKVFRDNANKKLGL